MRFFLFDFAAIIMRDESSGTLKLFAHYRFILFRIFLLLLSRIFRNLYDTNIRNLKIIELYRRVIYQEFSYRFSGKNWTQGSVKGGERTLNSFVAYLCLFGCSRDCFAIFVSFIRGKEYFAYKRESGVSN